MPGKLNINMNKDVPYLVLFFKSDKTYGLFKKSACKDKGGKIVSVGYGKKMFEAIILFEGNISIFLSNYTNLILFKIGTYEECEKYEKDNRIERSCSSEDEDALNSKRPAEQSKTAQKRKKQSLDRDSGSDSGGDSGSDSSNLSSYEPPKKKILNKSKNNSSSSKKSDTSFPNLNKSCSSKSSSTSSTSSLPATSSSASTSSSSSTSSLASTSSSSSTSSSPSTTFVASTSDENKIMNLIETALNARESKINEQQNEIKKLKAAEEKRIVSLNIIVI